MYKIEAIIRPHRLEAVQEALYDLDILGLTTSECRGTGRQRGVAHTFRGSQYSNNLGARIRVEVVLAADQLDAAVDAIQQAAMTGEVGDGKIFIFEVHDVVRIRTNERGMAALT